MRREQVLKVVLVLVGLLFSAGIFVLVGSVQSSWRANKESADPMFLSLYVTLGVFLLLAARNPSAHRSLIAYAGWANIAHAAVMTIMAIHLPNERRDLLVASGIFGFIGGVLVALAPAKQRRELGSTA
jgi:hypothetical protein